MLVSELGKLINNGVVIVKFRLIVVSSAADTDNLTANHNADTMLCL